MRTPFSLLILCLMVPLVAQEKITLTVPQSNPEYRLGHLVIVPDDPFTVGDSGSLSMDFKGLNGETISCRYGASTTPTATVLINGLNKANLSIAYAGNATTGSLKQRIAHRLVVMGESAQVCSKPLVGTLAGTVP